MKRKEIAELLLTGGFPLRKWSANNFEIFQNLSRDSLALDPLNISIEHASIAILGISWCPLNDYFLFKFEPSSSLENQTKRTVLSRVARLFDPMGALAPVIITAKILLQSLWLLKQGWDNKLSSEIIQQWQYWQDQLSAIKEIMI